MSYIDDKITKEDFFERIYKKSKSENSRHNTEIALRNLELFCQHAYKKDMDVVIDDLVDVNNARKVFTFFQQFIDFLQEDHPNIQYRPPQKNAKSMTLEACPSTHTKRTNQRLWSRDSTFGSERDIPKLGLILLLKLQFPFVTK